MESPPKWLYRIEHVFGIEFQGTSVIINPVPTCMKKDPCKTIEIKNVLDVELRGNFIAHPKSGTVTAIVEEEFLVDVYEDQYKFVKLVCSTSPRLLRILR